MVVGADRVVALLEGVEEHRGAEAAGLEERLADGGEPGVGSDLDVVVVGGIPVARSHRQAPEIDGVIRLDRGGVGEWVEVEYTGVFGPDMEAVQSSVVGSRSSARTKAGGFPDTDYREPMTAKP